MWIFESSPWSERVLALVRIVAGIVFASAGATKLFGWPPGPQPMAPVDPLSQLGIGALLEVVGGAAIVLGLATRPVALLLSGEMAVAYFQFHFPRSPYPTANQGMAAILYCLFYLYLCFHGAGAWSLDRILARRRREHAPRTAASDA